MSIRVLANDGAGTVLRTGLAAAVALCLLLVLLAALPAHSAGLSHRVHFDEADLRVLENGGVTRVSMAGLPDAGGVDDPALPMSVHSFFVPEGFEVADARIVRRQEVVLASGARLAGTALADPGSPVRPFPTGTSLESAETHPARAGASVGSGTMAGQRVHSVVVFPVQWNRASGELRFARSVDIELELVPVGRSADDLVALRSSPARDRAFGEALRSIVDNPQAVPVPDAAPSAQPGGFSPRDLPSLEGSAVDMVIVTTDALAADFQGLADWKTKKGITTVVRTTSWIDTHYPAGHDGAERIRMFLQDAYSRWGVWLVLLGGDYNQVPVRLAWNRFFFGGTEIPTDQYYACLSGDWNADGDHLYGEGMYQSEPGDLVDLMPDVFVGRAGVDSPAEVATFLSKSMTYDRTPPAGYVEKVCYLAEVLFPHDWEFGDPPGQITLDGADLTDEFDLLLPPAWARQKCYQVNNLLDRGHALNELSSGQHHLMTLMNHGDAFKFSVGNGLNPLVYVADTDTLSNGDHLMFVMATACNPNQFDLECQGESFVNNPNGGAVAVLGPTREDFPLSAANYHEVMLRFLFQNDVTRYGAMSQIHRVPFVPLSQTDSTPDRWTMLTKLLLGDPELRFWTQEPADLTVTHPANVALGTGTVTVHVEDDLAMPVADALVCVSDGNGTYSRGRTDAAGDAVLELSSAVTGTVDVVVTAPEFLPSETTFTLGAAAGAHLALTSFTIDDDGSGPSSGNGDGIVDAGETIELGVEATNGGTLTASGVSVTAAIEAGTEATFDFLYGGVSDPSRVHVGPDGTNPPGLPFTLDFTSPSIEYIGRPNTSFAPDSVADAGVWLWQDEEGWHLRWSAGPDSVEVSGSVTTDGRVRGYHTLEMEADLDSASLNGPEDTLTFAGTTHATDLLDGLDFALADGTMLSISGANANLGDIGASSSAVGTVVYDVATNARNGQIGYVDLTFSSVALATWTEEVPVVFAGPELEAWVFLLDDSNNPPVSGNGDGIIQVGETVRVLPSVLNRGTGAAVSVDGAASAAGNITFLDSADSYGEIGALGQSAGTDGYVFTVVDASGTSIDLVLTDSLGRTWAKNIDFVAPADPQNPFFGSSESEIVIGWDASAEADLAGYNVYRSATPGGASIRLNYELLRSGARYADQMLPLGSTFYYTISAVDSSGNEGARSSEVEAWTTTPQVGGWPRNANSNVFSGIALVDADNDGSGQMEVYVGSQDFKMYGWQADGDPIDGWPLAANAAVWSTPAVADLDKDGDQEIMWGAMDSRFYVTHHDASPMYGVLPYIFDIQGNGETMRGVPVIADVDGDAQLEYFVGTDLGTLYGFEHDASPIAGASDSLGLIYTAPQTNEHLPRIWGPIAVGDLDGDGTRELVFTSWNDNLYVISPDGTDRAGFPITHPEDFRNGPSLGDLDGNGTLEIVVCNFDGKVYVWEHDGTEFLTGSGGVFAALPAALISTAAICQLDGDPELEIVVSCMDGAVYAFNHDGTGFSQAGGLLAMLDSADGISASPIVVDVDGDSDMEVLVGHRNGNFYGVHLDGSRIAGMPIPTGASIFSTAAAADIDQDGDVDVAFASYDQTVNVLDFTGASSPGAYEWATQGANNWRTSVYGEPGPWQTGVGPVLGTGSLPFALAQNTPNPFRTGTSIAFSLPADQRVSLRVFNVEGRLVRTLAEGPMTAGRATVVWDGRDQQGRRLSSGVYFYRLENGQGALTRKSVMLR